MINGVFRVAALVVLYHPPADVLDNIRSWVDQVGTVFAVDNSEGVISEIVSAIGKVPKVVLIRSGENEGIARALNIGAEMAEREGYNFLLTMDQDSYATSDLVSTMLGCMTGLSTLPIGIVSPFHLTKSGHTPGKELCQEVMTPMTSGCLLSLAAYRKTGPFRDELFIDFVDNEYCLRLRRAGYAVLRANRALLKHLVGDTKKYGPFIATNHSPLRRYYKTRNRFYVFSCYVGDFPGHCIFDLVRMTKEVLSIILFEDEKLRKLRMMWRGWSDFRHSKFGKYIDADC